MEFKDPPSQKNVKPQYPPYVERNMQRLEQGDSEIPIWYNEKIAAMPGRDPMVSTQQLWDLETRRNDERLAIDKSIRELELAEELRESQKKKERKDLKKTLTQSKHEYKESVYLAEQKELEAQERK